MKHRNPFYVVCLVLLLGIFLAVNVNPAWAFAEEELGFRDQDGSLYPPSGDFPDNRISSIHDDLTLALAIAAGFSPTDSQTIRIWDQLVDSENLPSAPTAYTYGNAGFYTAPDPAANCSGKNRARQIWPTNSFNPITSAATSRFGPYSPFFHFPHLNGSDLQALRDWAWGTTDTLQGYEAYAWGRLTDLTLMQAVQNNGCIITRSVQIPMPVPAGSLEAFATYLHSLGDAYSHKDCLDALAAQTPPAPWGTHTVKLLGDTSVPACDYNPSNPQNDDAHGREFGSTYSDTQRTITAARAIYAELSERSLTNEGLYVPLSLTTTLTISGSATTLDAALINFVTRWNYDQPSLRREYIDSLVQSLSAQQRILRSTPVVTASDGTDTSGVNVSWPALSGVDYYLGYRSDSLDGVKIPTTGVLVSGLSGADIWGLPGVTYYYWVKACNASACSEFSAPETGWRGLTPPVVTASDGTDPSAVDVNWTASSGATSYQGYRSDSPGGVKIPSEGVLVSGLGGADIWGLPGVTYSYWVKACSSAGCSAFSAADTGWR